MRRRIGLQLAIALCLCLLASSACASNAKVEGRVTVDGNPLADTTVELAGGKNAIPTTQTDANGRFVFTDVPPDTYTLTVTLEGERERCVIVTAFELKTGKQFSHDFKLEKTIYLVGELSLLEGGEVCRCVSK